MGYTLIIFSIISISSILFIAKHFLPKSFIEVPNYFYLTLK